MSLQKATSSILLILSCFFVCSCAYMIKLTPEASKLKVVSDSSNCQIIDTVVGSHDMGRNVGEDMESALNDAKNKAAELGADSIRIISSDSVSTITTFSTGASTVLAEALICNK